MIEGTRAMDGSNQEQERSRLLTLFAATRARTEALASRLSPEDQQLQSMPDASPTKWHRAHTTWFFETFVLAAAGAAPVDARYAFLFNSYYEAVGPRHARPKRGLLSRPADAFLEVRGILVPGQDRYVATTAHLGDQLSHHLAASVRIIRPDPSARAVK